MRAAAADVAGAAGCTGDADDMVTDTDTVDMDAVAVDAPDVAICVR